MANKQAFAEGQAVHVRTKIGGSVVLVPACVTSVALPAEDAPRGSRAAYTVSIEGGQGEATINEQALIPRAEPVATE